MTKTLTSFRLLRAILIMLVLAVVVPARAAIDITATQPANGTGTTDDPYQIGTPGELYWFAAKVNAGQTTISAKLVADIVVNDSVVDAEGNLRSDYASANLNEWSPVGVNTDRPFKGTFDGDGHTISGLYYSKISINYAGLFGAIDGATICNVTIKDSYVCGGENTGAVVGYTTSSTITNCHNQNTSINSNNYLIGGVCGKINNSSIASLCSSSGRVSSTGGSVGGVIGSVGTSSKVINSINYGIVTTTYQNVGGIAGYLFGTLTNCFNCGKVTAPSSVGGILGYNNAGTISNNYYLEGCATTTGGSMCYGVGGTSADNNQQTMAKDSAKLASGEVAYLLGDAWGQTIGTDAMPKLGGEKVYATQYIGCEGSSNYNNTGPSIIIERAHTFSADNICSECGKGSKPNLNGDVYEIANYGHLLWFADTVNNHGATSLKAKLTADIVVNENVLQPGTFNLNGTPSRVWTSIGTSNNQFKGTFDGNGHSISGLYFNNTANANENMYIALIGYATGATIKNVVVKDSYLRGYNYVAGICGYATGSTKITNCGYEGYVYGTSYAYGIAYNSSATVENCYSVSNQPLSNKATANCYHDNTKYSGSTSYSIGKSSSAFASGEVAWLLNGGSSDGPWGQTIGTDATPKLGGNKVYATAHCPHTNSYSNTPSDYIPITDGPEHYDADGFCKVCGAGHPATLVDGYYIIDDVAKLYWFAAKVNGGQTTINAKLVADIVVNDSVVDAEGNLRSDYASANLNEWSPAGVSTGNSFKGTFDGDGHTISGLYCSQSTINGAGLFGYISSATISNLTIKDSYICGRQDVGAIVGYSSSSTIKNCHNQNSTIKGNSNRTGGISGYLSGSTVRLCSNTGNISTTGSYVGGVTGTIEGNSVMENCYNLGKVTTTSSYAGGISGWLSGTLSNCMNYGKVTANSYVGGILGKYSSGTISNNYYLAGYATTSGGTAGYGIAGKNSDEEAKTMASDSAALASGEVAYLLGDAWGQKIGTDAMPKIGGEKVYVTIYTECTGHSNNYSNEGPATYERRDHDCNAEGVCTQCGLHLISTADQLYAFAAKVNAGQTTLCAKLTDDIVVNDSVIDINGDLRSDYASANLREWTPIGTKSSQFKGTFDGDGHTISGLYFNNTTNSDYPSGGNYIGLVGYANGSTISNLTIKDSYVNGYKQVGAIVGWAESSTITNCHNQNSTIISTTSRIGGVSGYLSASNMSLCSNSGNIYSGSYSTGGLSGSVDNSTMENCFNYGNVTVITISADHNAGGICGWVNVGTVKNCFNYGKVTAPSKIGGIVGNYSSGTISNNYYLAGCAATTSGVVGYGIAGKNSDEEAKTMASDSADFASGVISFLLNNRVSDSTSIWRQTIGVDATPKFSGSIVYLSSPCAKQFVNDTTVYVPHTHADDHICPICGKQITIEFIEAIANKVNYKVGDSLVVDSSLVVAKYNDLTSDTIPMTMEMVSSFESNMHGSYNVTVTYNGLTTTYAITVEHELKSIAIEAPQKTQYKVGDKLDLTGGKVIITFTDNCTETLPLAESMVSGFESNMQGSYEVTLTYGGESISYAITVEHELKSIAIEAPQKTQYKVGDKLDLTGGKVIITFTDNTTETLPLTESMVSGFSSLVAGNVVVTATYMGQTITYTIEVEGGQSISEAGAEVKIYAVNRNIVVETQEADGAVISVFNISGRKVAQCVANSNYMELPMQTAGMYVVHVGNTTCKVIVK